MMAAGPRWLTRPVLAWALYDVASSAFAAVVPVFFGLFFIAVVSGDVPAAQGRWGLIAALSLALAGVLAPFYGAWADRRGRWFGPLVFATALCAIATVSMPLAGRGGWLAAAILFVVAQVGYTLATCLYDSLLVRVAPPVHVGRVSGFGWAVGFAGGIVALLAAVGVMRGLPAEAQPARLSDAFLLAGLLFAAFAVPALAGLRRLSDAHAGATRARQDGRTVFASVLQTLRHWRRHREIFRFLLGYYLVNDVLVTILFFVAIILRARFGLTIEGLLWLALLYHVLASPSTFLFGHLADRWGQQPSLPDDRDTRRRDPAARVRNRRGDPDRRGNPSRARVRMQAVWRSLFALLVDVRLQRDRRPPVGCARSAAVRRHRGGERQPGGGAVVAARVPRGRRGDLRFAARPGAGPRRRGSGLAGREALARLLLLGAGLEHQLVGRVVLVDVAHVRRGLDADLLGGDELDVVEPLVRIEAALGRLLAHLRDPLPGPAL
jgi:UMF1 family MFS transporter